MLKIIIAALLALSISGCVSTQKAEVKEATVSTTAAAEAKHELSYSDFSRVMIPVKSTAISEIGYLENEKILGLRFKESGVFYAYADVPKSVYQEFIKADSIGRYFNANIKPNYDYILKVKD